MKRIFALLLVSLFAVSLTGCNFPNMTDYLASITYTEVPGVLPTDEPVVTNTPDLTSPEPTPEMTPAPTEIITDPLPSGIPEDISDFARNYILSARDIMDEVIEYISNNPIDGSPNSRQYMGQNKFRELSSDELELYERLYVSAVNYSIIGFDAEEETINKVKTALFTDHPELEIYFDVDRNSDGGRLSGAYKTVFFMPEGRYYGPAQDMEALKEQVEAFNLVADYVAGRVPSEFSAIDKYRCLAYYITVNSDYAHVQNEEIPRYAMNAYGAIMNGWSICQGYAYGFDYLCRRANLDCRVLTNARTDDALHYWDIVTINEGSYFVDVTWSDGQVRSDYTNRNWFNYFMFIPPAEEQVHVAIDGTVTSGAVLDKNNWN